MAGYYGCVMSNNAVRAYRNGEMPLSRWTKTILLERIEKAVGKKEIALNCSMKKLKKLSKRNLQKICLYYSSWHHTGYHYKRTDFYSFDGKAVEELNNETLNKMLKEQSVKEKKKEEKWECAFLEWTGTKKHPVCKRYQEIGIIRGNWFIRPNGKKKSVNANGFYRVRKVKEKAAN